MKWHLLIWAALVSARMLPASDPGAAEVFAKTAAAYKNLKVYQITGEVQIVANGRNGTSAFEYKTTLAADGEGRSYVENLSGAGAEVRISNGETTWKYFGGKKVWSKEQLAQVSDSDDEEAEEAPVPQDLFSQTQRSFIARYVGLPRFAASAVYLKDEKLKFNGAKVLCHGYRVAGKKGIASELWIDDQSFYVVRHREQSPTSQLVTEYREINSGAPDRSLFDFQPPAGSREVANILLPSEREVSLVGTPAADFSLKTLEGEPVRLSELRGKVVMLDFWASWCPPCRHELPMIVQLSRKLKDTNVLVFGVNDEDRSKAKHFLDTSHYDLVTLHDGGHKVGRQFSCYAIPTVFIIDPNGKIAAQYVGERSEKEFLASLRAAGMK